MSSQPASKHSVMSGLLCLQLKAQPAGVDTFSSDPEQREASGSEEEKGSGPASGNVSSEGRHGRAKSEEEGDGEARGMGAADRGEQRRYPLRVRTQQEPLPLQPARHSRSAGPCAVFSC